MVKMTKIVDVYPARPIYGLAVPITTAIKSQELSIGDIGICINCRALVDEILADGTKVRLSLSNYDKDNSGTLVVAEVKPAKTVTEPVKAPEPVAPPKVEHKVEEPTTFETKPEAKSGDTAKKFPDVKTQNTNKDNKK